MFTPEELEAMRLADKEIEAEFAANAALAAGQIRDISEELDLIARMDGMDTKSAKKFLRQRQYRAENKDAIAERQRQYYAERKKHRGDTGRGGDADA